MQLGSTVLISLVPVLLRMHYIRLRSRAIEREQAKIARDQLYVEFSMRGDVFLSYPLSLRHRVATRKFYNPALPRMDMTSFSSTHTYTSCRFPPRRPFGLGVSLGSPIKLQGSLSDQGTLRTVHAYERNIEYLAMSKVVKWVLLFTLGCYLIGVIGISLAIHASPENLTIMEKNGYSSSLYVALFITVSAFNNAGFSVFQSNLCPFAESPLILVIVAFLIVAGNTLYPVFLRLLLANRRKGSVTWRVVYTQLLENPRKIYTHVFPRDETLTLLIFWAVFTLWEALTYVGCEWDNADLAAYSGGARFFINAFTSISTRSAGFNIIDLNILESAVLTLYILMMIIAPLPFIFTLFKTTVKVAPEQPEPEPVSPPPLPPEPAVAPEPTFALPPPPEPAAASPPLSPLPPLLPPLLPIPHEPAKGTSEDAGEATSARASVAVSHRERMSHYEVDAAAEQVEREIVEEHRKIRVRLGAAMRQFIGMYREETIARDLAFLWLAWWVILLSESDGMKAEPEASNPFKAIFEIASAYGNVGLTLGHPSTPCSYSAVFNPVSKVVVIFVFLLGKHRGLPLSIDPAVNIGKLLVTDAVVAQLVKQPKAYEQYLLSMNLNMAASM
eukprot:gnl/Chilomastix_cuspidata/1010.p1 GENE.gnl/Chilomastix_cuspidata/1010~~gnl/Chilomastix_cuspidata/1010.p1  ORF type:complete len:711 (+),score=295.18 gnl/Chilomastix_cuspidata/1010:294-2135(+)